MTNQYDNAQIDDVQHLLNRAQSAKDTGDLELTAAILTDAALIETENWDIAKELLDVAKALVSTNSAAVLITINFMLANYASFDHEPLYYLDYPLFNRGWDLIMAGEMARGEELLRAGLRFNPDDPWFLRSMGYYLLNQHRYDEGISFLEKYNELYEYEDEVLESIEAITWAYCKLDQKDYALQYLLENLIFFSDGVANIYLRLVNILDDNKAIEAISNLLFKVLEDEELENRSAILSAVFLESAKLFQKIREPEKAIDLYALVHNDDKLKPEVLVGFGHALLEAGFPDKAMEIADQAAEITPENQSILALRAQALIALRNYQSALQTADDGLMITPRGASTNIREETQDYFTRPTLGQIEPIRYLRERDARMELILSKIDALTGLNQYDEAIDLLQIAQEEYSQEIIFYRYAAAIYQKTGHPERALGQFKKARRRGLTLDKPSLELQKRIKTTIANQA